MKGLRKRKKLKLSRDDLRMACVMHGSILPVTIPPGQPRGQVQPFGPGVGNCLRPSCPGGRGAGQIENNFLLFL